ncbi:DUF4241 domain-containing protein [Micromonospora taraxaci]|uniref:DUF4241 domain-containing protein n=1 Tax=Micromonospora taraxaci TaxID=1316803 RepID=UPI003409B2C7
MARREGDKNCCRKQSAGTEEGPELQDRRVTAMIPLGFEPRLGQDVLGLGYPANDVNAGAGCFTDEQTFRRLSEESGSGWQLTLLEDLAWMRDGPTVIPRAEVDGSSGDDGDENVLVAFPSGEGDGTYRTWVGRTRGGEITCFVTDFLLHDA